MRKDRFDKKKHERRADMDDLLTLTATKDAEF